GHVLGKGVVGHIPVARAQGSVASVNRLEYPCGADNQMAAAAWNASWRTVIAAGNPAVEKVVWHDERSGVAEPVARYPCPWGKLIGAVTNATANRAPVVTLKKAET